MRQERSAVSCKSSEQVKRIFTSGEFLADAALQRKLESIANITVIPNRLPVPYFSDWASVSIPPPSIR